MNSFIYSLFAFIIIIIYGFSSAELSCYSCKGEDSECPVTLTETETDLPTVQCHGVLGSVCGKYSIELANGDIYTYRDCSPPNLETEEFCSFINSIYSPSIDQGIITNLICNSCNFNECNI